MLTTTETPTLEAQYQDLGYTSHAGFFDDGALRAFEQGTLNLLILQAKKIGEYRARVLEIAESSKSTFEKFSLIYDMLEGTDKEALYQIQKFFPNSQQTRALFSPKLMNLCASLLKSSSEHLLIDGPAVFVNRPNTQRLLYKWHSEAHYYPKRRRFLNVWFPLFDNKSKQNGTMSFKLRSHKREWPFAEYKGFNKDTENKANHFVQFEIPSNLLERHEEHFCESKRGDLILFQRNLVHRSNQNLGSSFSVAGVARIWDPSDDLTLSGQIAATPYGGDIGRADLVVNDD